MSFVFAGILRAPSCLFVSFVSFVPSVSFVLSEDLAMGDLGRTLMILGGVLLVLGAFLSLGSGPLRRLRWRDEA